MSPFQIDSEEILSLPLSLLIAKAKFTPHFPPPEVFSRMVELHPKDWDDYLNELPAEPVGLVL